MYNIIIIFVCLLLGLLLQKVKRFPTNAYKLFNHIVIYFCLPSLALFFIPKIQLDSHLLYPIAVSWIGFTTSILFFSFLGWKLKWSRKLTGCMIMTAGFSNTSFLGFPIIQALYGEEGLKMAILVDQPGTFVVLSTLGVFIATYYSTGSANGLQIIKKILFFPPFIAFLLACFMNVFHYDFHEFIQFSLQKVGSIMTPLAMLSVGLQLQFDKKSKHFKFLRLGLLYKLILTPALIYLLYVVILNQHSTMIKVSVMEAAMAPMISSSIIASSYGLKPRLCSMMIGFGIPLSFITLIFWGLLMRFI
ncbi:AEC family transporter [Flavobacterium gilvum]|uniref:Transporter n=1 Tax=Flavobacterium gilvum TaxID=1492737 RepID=A0AAC9I533_9FLAO|nr:AEC family transporter [Flavobacterium gilvum]AOW09561.1 transporter [Flavobacterium gilvum]KFC58977.1 transporter [Flavobacterium gilvum]